MARLWLLWTLDRHKLHVAPPHEGQAGRESILTPGNDNERWRRAYRCIRGWGHCISRICNRADNNSGLSLVQEEVVSPAQRATLGDLDDQLKDTPAWRLRSARLKKNLTIAKLAEVANVHVSTIGDAENGRLVSSLPILRKLAAVLDVSVSYLGCFDKLPERTLGQRIQKARLCKGLMKIELAEILGVAMKTLRDWEDDKHKPLKRNLAAMETYFHRKLQSSI